MTPVTKQNAANTSFHYTAKRSFNSLTMCMLSVYVAKRNVLCATPPPPPPLNNKRRNPELNYRLHP